MKLKAELPMVLKRIEILKSKHDIIAYREELRTHGEYKDFTIRFVNDIKDAILSSSEICDWYKQYQCHDTHINSLMKEACKRTGLL